MDFHHVAYHFSGECLEPESHALATNQLLLSFTTILSAIA
jgi:hypothetical protein